MDTVDTLIAKAGGTDVVSAKLEVTHYAILKWREKGQVPSKHWRQFSAMTGWSIDRVSKIAKANAA